MEDGSSCPDCDTSTTACLYPTLTASDSSGITPAPEPCGSGSSVSRPKRRCTENTRRKIAEILQWENLPENSGILMEIASQIDKEFERESLDGCIDADTTPQDLENDELIAPQDDDTEEEEESESEDGSFDSSFIDDESETEENDVPTSEDEFVSCSSAGCSDDASYTSLEETSEGSSSLPTNNEET
jgi:hypothetical protein